MAFTLHHANSYDSPSVGNDYLFSNSSNNLTSLSKSTSSTNSSRKQKKNNSYKKEIFVQQQCREQFNTIYMNTNKKSNNIVHKKSQEVSMRKRYVLFLS